MTINIAIVGVGYWGPNLVRNFYQLEDVKIHTVCDIREEQLDFIRKNYPTVRLTKDFNEVLNNHEIQAVAIALPTELHYQFAKRVLAAGKHVLVEKPMTQTSQEAQDLIDLAEKQGKILAVDYPFVYHGPVLKLKEIIDSGEIGEIRYFDSQRINLGLIRNDTNVVWDLAPHDISIMNFLIKEKPISLSAVGTSHVGGQREELAHLTVKYPAGLVAHIHVSWLSPVKLRQILIGGTKKMLLYDDIQPTEKIKVYDHSVEVDLSKETPFEPIYRQGEIRIPVFDSKEALLKECEDFVSCIKNNKKPLTDGYSGLAVVKILEACDKSLKEKGQEISFK